MKKRKQILTGILAVYFILTSIVLLTLFQKEAKAEDTLQREKAGKQEETGGSDRIEEPEAPDFEAVGSDTESSHETEISANFYVSENQSPQEEAGVSENQSSQEEAGETEPDNNIQYCRSITKQRVNIRETPQMNGKIIGKIEYGKIGTIVEEDKDGWTKVTFGEVTGYCTSEVLELVPEEEVPGN